MEFNLATLLSLLSIVFVILNFGLSRKDKSNKDVQEEQKQFSKHDLIEYRLDKIEKQLEKILNKLDTFDKEMDEKIKIAFKHHIAEFHNKEN